MKFAPETPTTNQLHKMYPIDEDIELSVLNKRLAVNHALSPQNDGFLAIVGPCAYDGPEHILMRESQRLNDLAKDLGIVALQRQAFWKPRSNPNDWHGAETTEPMETYHRIHENARLFANGAGEIGRYEHVERYAQHKVIVWVGARNQDRDLKLRIANWDHSLSLGIKNSLDGSIDNALEEIALINKQREAIESSGRAVLIYRGGANSPDPNSWQDNYLRAYEATAGNLIVDSAHGGEMAFHPRGEYKKSIIGQQRCLSKISEFCLQGYRPKGVMIEASDVASRVDPNMPFEDALAELSFMSASLPKANLSYPISQH